MNYSDFLNTKAIVDVPTGFEPTGITSAAFDFQRDCVRWACRRGRAALFEDCGLGKTIQELLWAQQVVEHTNRPVLILTPLSVTAQFVREGKKFGIPVTLARQQSDIGPAAIYVTNYEKLHRFDLSDFAGIVLDESSILKSYNGATRDAIIQAAARLPYKLAGTATPAPNDYMELGNHAEFLGVMSRSEMLSTFFVHDGGDTSKWRLKGHAEDEFWLWLCSWAVNIRKPSDLGYADGDFKLPPLNLIEHVVDTHAPIDGFLLALPASTLDERRNARRASLTDRVSAAADIASGSDEQWVFWADLNAESEAIADAAGAVEIAGSTSEDERERITLGFLDGSIRSVVTKPSIWGFGMNLQCCHNTALVGISDSYERFYQVLRRFWRFGQTREVKAHIIVSSLEGAVLSNIKRKERDATRMADEMVKHMADISSVEIRGVTRDTIKYQPTNEMTLPIWLTE